MFDLKDATKEIPVQGKVDGTLSQAGKLEANNPQYDQ